MGEEKEQKQDHKIVEVWRPSPDDCIVVKETEHRGKPHRYTVSYSRSVFKE